MASFTVHDVKQRSPEWFALRVGLLTGSQAPAIIQQRKKGTGELAVRAALRQRIVCERITGIGVDDLPFLPYHMQRAEDLEPMAFAAYEWQTGHVALPVGFVSHPTLKSGCSPDGRVGAWTGGLELKCPKPQTHLEYIQKPETLRAEYEGQAIHGLWLTGAEWWDLCSYDDRFKAPLDLVRVRILASEVDLVAYELAVTMFLQEVDRAVEDVEAIAARTVAA